MKKLFVLLASLILTACNSYGPYDGTVTRLRPELYHVLIGTWLGSERGWPNGSEELKLEFEAAAKVGLKEQGIDFDVCAFDSFIPYEGGHMTASLIAGSNDAIQSWRALGKEEKSKLFLSLSSVDLGKFQGRLPIPKEVPNQSSEPMPLTRHGSP